MSRVLVSNARRRTVAGESGPRPRSGDAAGPPIGPHTVNERPADGSRTLADPTFADAATGDRPHGLDELTQWRLVGRGGFATVYAARQERLGRLVAVKILDDRPGPDVVRAFLRECEIMGALSAHPHIVTVHDAGVTDDGHPYLVMEYITE